MRRTLSCFGLMAIILLLIGCVSMTGRYALVEPPRNSGSSLLVLEVGNKSGQYHSALTNNGNTGWIPWVVDHQGKLVHFKLYDSDLHLDSLYYAEDVKPGMYTLKGFVHIWSDTSKSPKLSAFSFNPYDNLPYQGRQEFALQDPITLRLAEAQIASFGRYFIKAVWKGGYASPAYDRWMIDPTTFFAESLPGDPRALEVLALWKTPVWMSWVRNRTLVANGMLSTPKEDPVSATVQEVDPESARETFADRETVPVIPSVQANFQSQGILAFDAGGWHTMIVRADGTVWGVGNNERGQLGTPDTTNQAKPITMFGHTRSLALGQSFSLVLRQDGTVWATGNNHAGVLGDGTNDDASSFHLVAEDTESIAAGYIHSILVKQDGSLWTAGDNRGGQLGDGTQ